MLLLRQGSAGPYASSKRPAAVKRAILLLEMPCCLRHCCVPNCVLLGSSRLPRFTKHVLLSCTCAHEQHSIPQQSHRVVQSSPAAWEGWGGELVEVNRSPNTCCPAGGWIISC